MKVITQLEEARQRHSEAIEKMEEFAAKAQALPDDSSGEERDFFAKAFGSSKDEAARWAERIERMEAIEDARRTMMRHAMPEDTQADDGEDGKAAESKKQRDRIAVGAEPLTYRMDNSHEHSFFADLYRAAIKGDPVARNRLDRHAQEVKREKRDISTASTAGGGFVPPIYLGDMYAPLARESRPFADVVPTSPLMASGMTITIPRITTGTTAAVFITENVSTVSDTDIVDSNLSIPVRTIAGQQDVSQQLLDRSDPGIDTIIFSDLRAAYDALLDQQLLAGTGSNGQHLGIRAVSGVNTVTYTSATPTAAAMTPKLYDGIQQIATNRYMPAQVIVMHPRRAAHLASNLSSTFPLFQVGNLTQAAGSQDIGQIINVSGLRVVADANVGVIYSEGGSTNEDEVYVVRVSDLHLWEGPIQTRVLPDVGSATLTVRLQLFAYSAFASARYAKSISIIKGSGLAAPSF